MRVSFPDCISIGERNPHFLFFEFYLLILEGTFSDDMITTGMFLKDDDSCKNHEDKKKNLIKFPIPVCLYGKENKCQGK